VVAGTRGIHSAVSTEVGAIVVACGERDLPQRVKCRSGHRVMGGDDYATEGARCWFGERLARGSACVGCLFGPCNTGKPIFVVRPILYRVLFIERTTNSLFVLCFFQRMANTFFVVRFCPKSLIQLPTSLTPPPQKKSHLEIFSTLYTQYMVHHIKIWYIS
jgi:hypothetical protein